MPESIQQMRCGMQKHSRGFLPLIESQQFVRRWIHTAHVPMRCQSLGQGDNNKPSSFRLSPPVSTLAMSAGTPFRKLRKQLHKTRSVVGLFLLAPLSAHNSSKREDQAERRRYWNCVFTVHPPTPPPSFPPSLPLSLTPVVHFSPPVFSWKLCRAKGTIQITSFSRALLLSSSVSCCYITDIYEASSVVTPDVWAAGLRLRNLHVIL